MSAAYRGYLTFRRLAECGPYKKSVIGIADENPAMPDYPRSFGDCVPDGKQTVRLARVEPFRPFIPPGVSGTEGENLRRIFRAPFKKGGKLYFPAGQDIRADGGLVSLFGRVEKDSAGKGVGKVLLGNPVFTIAVRVEIPLTVTESFLVAVSVAQMVGNFGVFFFNGGERIEISEGTVGFRCGCEIQRGMGKMILSFGKSDPVKSFSTGRDH